MSRNIYCQNNKTGLFEKCLYDEINQQIIALYFQELINNKFLSFEHTNIMINNENYSLKTIINIILNSSVPNKPQSFIDFIKLIKIQFCVNCKDMNNNSYFLNLPFFCSFCSSLCFISYFKNYSYNFQRCPYCNTNFTMDEKIIIFNKLYNGKCCIDGSIYSPNYSKKIPKNKFYIPYESNYFLDHYFCNDCLKQMEKSYSNKQFN